MPESEPGEHGGEGAIVHRTLDVHGDDPEVDLAAKIAELEGRESLDLPAMYDTIDHLIEYLFSNPPPSEAQARLEFTYEGYRISVDQDGHAMLLKVS